MFKNYLKIAWRNLVKNKAFTLLNIIGLTVSFSVFILLSMVAFFDLSYDKYHKNLDEIYQLYSIKQIPGSSEVAASNPFPLTETIKNEVPGIENISRYLYQAVVVSQNKNDVRLGTYWVDPDFVSIFSLPAIEGNAFESLNDKNTIVLTEKAAQKLFGNSQVVGKTLHLMVNGKQQPFKIGAILKDIPKNSSIQFEMLINIKSFSEYERLADDWSSRNHDVFIQLKKEVSKQQFEKSAQAFTDLHFSEDIENSKRDGALPNFDGRYFDLKILPYKDVHYTNFSGDKIKISHTYSILLFSISFLILFIACVNFINMGIASSGKRLKEIGMRKTLGANKKQLFFQLWSESFIIFTIALFFGVVVSYLLLPDFQELFRTNASFLAFKSFKVVLIVFTTILTVSLLSGGYPALVLGKLGTIQALKGKISVKSGQTLRHTIIVIQFGFAILLMTGAIVLYSQLQFLKNKDLGYNKEQVLSFMMNGKKDSDHVIKLLRDELSNYPDVIDITASDINMGRGRDGSSFSSILGFEHQGREVKTNMLIVDYNFPETLEIPIISGRSFNRNFATDSLSVMVNETMAKSLNEKEVLGSTIMIDSLNYSVIGIVKDYNFQKLDRAIAPITLFLTSRNWSTQYAFVKISSHNMISTYDHIKEVWNKIEPNAPFLGSFLDENIDRTLRNESAIITMISSGSLIAIVLSCIGLFAMSLLIISERTKEIGIRKVLGASIGTITIILMKDFLKLVGISFLIAAPVAWLLLNNWLQQYAYRIDLSLWYFLLAGITSVLVVLITIGGKSIRAAVQNPVKSLRSE